MTVAEKHRSLNSPVVIDEIRIVKIHAPPLSLRRETAQEQYLGGFWQERL
jgi:hypothetical protein